MMYKLISFNIQIISFMTILKMRQENNKEFSELRTLIQSKK
jgi:hypothetical protein